MLRFGVFELDAVSGELRKEGALQPRLREQSLRILLMLIERPREVVTRDELRERLWSADTFVDFDHGLNAAINQLRNALGDSAASPRFIQTLPRRGYRFIAPVENMAEVERLPAAPVETGKEDAREVAARSLLSEEHDLPAAPSELIRALFAAIQVLYLVFYVVALARLGEVHEILAEAGDPVRPVLVLLIATAAAGIPVRLYLLSAAAFNYGGLGTKFRRLFPFVLALDELWALAPFLAVQLIGIGAAIAVSAGMVYLPFSQRSLVLMSSREREGS